MRERLQRYTERFLYRVQTYWAIARVYPRRSIAIITSTVIIFLLLITFAVSASAPEEFPTNVLVTLPAKASAVTLTDALVQDHLIRSSFLFYAVTRLSKLDTSLEGGAYIFDKPLNVFDIARRLGNGEHGITASRITLTEGMTTLDMANTLGTSLVGFNLEAFLDQASTSEGYLFPDTYFIFPNTPESAIISRLTSTFGKKVASTTPMLSTSTHSLHDIVIMASILEREANNPTDMKIVSGILWNRIQHGMPLQVDAVFGYIHKQNGYTPTAADLVLTSPYNTYRTKGLPPTPIDNPGIDALLAAAFGGETKYVYYLTGRDGKMHYAITFDDHKKNRALYLD